jgi:hypothetical protein
MPKERTPAKPEDVGPDERGYQPKHGPTTPPPPPTGPAAGSPVPDKG